MLKIDNSSLLPVFAVPSYQLGVIPRSQPEELNNISVIDRLNKIEEKWTKCQERIDQTMCENIALSERVDTLEKHSQPTYSSIASGVVKPPPVSIQVETPSINEPVRYDGSQKIPSHDRARHDETDIGVKYRPPSQRIQTDDNTGRSSLNGQNYRPLLRFPDPTTNYRGSTENLDNISVKSNISGISGFQYQRQYRKKLQQAKPKTVTGSNIHRDETSCGFRGAPVTGSNIHRDETSCGFRGAPVTGSNIHRDETSCGFRGAPEPDRHLFLFRVRPEATESDIERYLKDQNLTYRSLSCMSNPNARFKSFKLTVGVSQYDALFNDGLWPNGVMVRPFRAYKNIESNNG